MKVVIEIPDSQVDCVRATVAAGLKLDPALVDEVAVGEFLRNHLCKCMTNQLRAMDREKYIAEQMAVVAKEMPPVDLSKYTRAN